MSTAASPRRSRALRRGRFIRMVGVAATLIAGGRTARAPVAVDELELRFALRPGGPTVQTFRVSNEGDSAAQVTIGAQDWDRDETGQNRFYPLGELSTSCRSRVVVSPTVFQLA